MKRAGTGTLIGSAIGDALGRPTQADGVPFRQLELPTPASLSDSIRLTLALGRGLHIAMERGYLAQLRLVRPVREEFVNWYHAPESNRAPDRTCLAACRLLAEEGRAWQKASQVGSKGSGATVRAAPIGLAPGLNESQRAGAAQLQAALTHGHPTALAASDLTAHTIHALAHGTSPADLLGELQSYARGARSHYYERWLGDLWTHAVDHHPLDFMERGFDECLTALNRLDRTLRAPDPEDDPCLATGAGRVAEEALATGLLCFLLFPDEPVTALRRAARTSGDSVAVAGLTGAFAGACHGMAAWPEEWAERIDCRDELVALGARWDEDGHVGRAGDEAGDEAGNEAADEAGNGAPGG